MTIRGEGDEEDEEETDALDPIWTINKSLRLSYVIKKLCSLDESRLHSSKPIDRLLSLLTVKQSIETEEEIYHTCDFLSSGRSFIVDAGMDVILRCDVLTDEYKLGTFIRAGGLRGLFCQLAFQENQQTAIRALKLSLAIMKLIPVETRSRDNTNGEQLVELRDRIGDFVNDSCFLERLISFWLEHMDNAIKIMALTLARVLSQYKSAKKYMQVDSLLDSISNEIHVHLKKLSNRDYFGTKNMEGSERKKLREAIGFVRNLAVYSPETRKILFEKGFADTVLRVLISCKNEEIIEQALYCLGNLCVRHGAAIQFMLKRRIINTLISFIWWKGKKEVRVAASFAVRNMCSNANPPVELKEGEEVIERERNTEFCTEVVAHHFKKIRVATSSNQKVKTLLGGLIDILASTKGVDSEHADIAVKLVTSIPLQEGLLQDENEKDSKSKSKGKKQNLITGSLGDHIADMAMPVLVKRLKDLMEDIEGLKPTVEFAIQVQEDNIKKEKSEEEKSEEEKEDQSSANIVGEDIVNFESEIFKEKVVEKIPNLGETKLLAVLKGFQRKWLNMSNILSSIGHLAENISVLKAEQMIDTGIVDHLLTILSEGLREYDYGGKAVLGGALQTLSTFACNQSICIIIISKCGNALINELLPHEDSDIQWSTMHLMSAIGSKSPIAQEQMLYKHAILKTVHAISNADEYTPCIFVKGMECLANLMKGNEDARSRFIDELNGIEKIAQLRQLSISILEHHDQLSESIYEEATKATLESIKKVTNQQCAETMKLLSKPVTPQALEDFRQTSNDPWAQIFRNWDKKPSLRKKLIEAELED